MMAKIEALVADAIGIDVNRGDSLTVSSSAFIQQLEGVEAQWHEGAWFRSALNQLAMILILAIVILGIVRPLLNRILVPSASTAAGIAEGEDSCGN
jgi:flagellar M-ring protein FliF